MRKLHRKCENIEDSVTSMEVDLRSFQDKIKDSFDDDGSFKGLYEFKQVDMEFFEVQLGMLKSACYAMYMKIGEKEKQVDEKIAEEKSSDPEKNKIALLQDQREDDEELLKLRALKERLQRMQERQHMEDPNVMNFVRSYSDLKAVEWHEEVKQEELEYINFDQLAIEDKPKEEI